MVRFYINIIIGGIMMVLFSGCLMEEKSDSIQMEPNLKSYVNKLCISDYDTSSIHKGFDIDKIQARGKLVAITGYSSTSYFIYHGRPMGYEYELLKKLADHLGVELEIVIAKNIREMTEKLLRGEGDVIAYSLAVTNNKVSQIEFTRHHNLVRQVLVQRKPENWRGLKLHQIEDSLVREPVYLAGKTIFVERNSVYLQRMLNLSQEIGGGINIVEAEKGIVPEELIRQVSNGDIDYTVADENVALLNSTYYDNIDVRTPVSFSQKIAWAVRKSSPQLKKRINYWIDSLKGTSDYYAIYNRYYRNRKAYKERYASRFFSLNGTQLCEYDKIIKKYADEIKFDWRLLASQVYQESRFNPQAESWAGAKGLMQVIPTTGKRFGGYNLYDPDESIRVGVKYLMYLNNFWKDTIPDQEERLKFILASYNAGPGHVMDARSLARKYGVDPYIWYDNVEVYMLKKGFEEFYNDEVVKFGYCRGQEPVNYVRQILQRYKHYTRLIPSGVPAKEETYALNTHS